MKVDTIVVDPGTSPYVGKNYIGGECAGWLVGGSQEPLHHSWQIVNLREDGGTWICGRCRRIERRVCSEQEAA